MAADADGRDMSYSRELIHCGVLEKKGGKMKLKWQYRWFELRGSILFYFEDRDLEPLFDLRRAAPRGDLTIDASVVVDEGTSAAGGSNRNSTRSGFTFSLSLNKPGRVRTLELRAQTALAAQAWISVLSELAAGVTVRPTPDAIAYMASAPAADPDTVNPVTEEDMHAPFSTWRLLQRARMAGYMRIFGPAQVPIKTTKIKSLKWTRFYFICVPPTLYYFENGLSEEPSGRLSLSDMHVNFVPLAPKIYMHVHSETTPSFYFEAEDEPTCAKWCGVARDAAGYEATAEGRLSLRQTLPGTRSFPKRQISPVTAVATHDYEKRGKDELTLTVGDEIVDIRPTDEPGWALGFSKVVGYGLFPLPFVEMTVPEPTEVRNGSTAIGLVGFKATNVGELSFPAGAVLTDVVEFGDPKWREGIFQGVRGLFPASFVRGDTPEEEETFTAVAKFPFAADYDSEISFHYNALITNCLLTQDAEWWYGTYDGSSGLFPRVFANIEPPVENPLVCRVLYDFIAGEWDEINLTAGGVVTEVVPTTSAQWFRGTFYCLRGMFPSEFVETVSDEDIITVAVAVADVTGSGARDLSFVRGDIIFNVTPVRDNGWADGWCNGVSGQFEAKSVKMFKVIKAEKSEDMAVINPDAVRAELVPFFEEGLEEVANAISTTGHLPAGLDAPDDATEVVESHKLNAAAAAAVVTAVEESSVGESLAIGAFVYVPVNDDELPIAVGDVMTCVTDAVDAGWLTGTLGEKVGVFPENHAVRLTVGAGRSLQNYDLALFTLESLGVLSSGFVDIFESLRHPTPGLDDEDDTSETDALAELTSALRDAGITADAANTYATTLVENDITTPSLLAEVTEDMYADMGITDPHHVVTMRVAFCKHESMYVASPTAERLTNRKSFRPHRSVGSPSISLLAKVDADNSFDDPATAGGAGRLNTPTGQDEEDMASLLRVRLSSIVATAKKNKPVSEQAAQPATPRGNRTFSQSKNSLAESRDSARGRYDSVDSNFD